MEGDTDRPRLIHIDATGIRPGKKKTLSSS